MVKEAFVLLLDENAFFPVFGTPLIKRNILILKRLGIEKIIILGKAKLYERLSKISFKEHFIYHSLNSIEQLSNIVSMASGDKVLVINAGHVLDPQTVKVLLESCLENSCKLVGEEDEFIILSKKDGLISAIKAIWKKEQIEAKEIRAKSGLPFIVKGKKDISRAEQMLIKSLSIEKRETDSFLAKNFDRKISLFFTKRLIHTPITPNQVTLMGMSIGLIGALLLSFPNYWTQLIGAMLFLFCVIVDGIDGEIARLKLKDSAFGHYLDIITDNIVHIGIFIGIGIGLYRKTGNHLYITLIWVLLFGFGLCAISVYQCILKKEDKIKKSPFLIKALSLLTNRDFAYLVVVLAIFEKLNWFFIMTAIGSYIFSATLWIADYLYTKRLS